VGGCRVTSKEGRRRYTNRPQTGGGCGAVKGRGLARRRLVQVGPVCITAALDRAIFTAGPHWIVPHPEGGGGVLIGPSLPRQGLHPTSSQKGRSPRVGE
jgi:hypothetical protein